MTKILNYLLGIIFFVLLIIVILMVFQIGPFNKTIIVPASPSKNSVTSTNNSNKIAVNKTYQDYINRANTLDQGNYPELAIAEYQAALQKFPDQIDPYYAIGRIYLRTSTFNQAEAIFKTVLQKKPNDLTATIYLARAYLGERKVQDAKTLLATIVNDNQELYFYKGITEAYLGNYKTAKNDLNKANSINGNKNIKAKINNFLNAFDKYNFNAEAPTVYLKVLLARSYDQTGEYQMAIGLLFEVTKDKSDYRDAWIILGHAYLEINKPNDALEALQRAKALDPDKSDTYFFLALSEYSLNQYQNAINDLLKAKKLGYQPEIQIEQKLAEIYLLQHNYTKSAASYKQVLASVNVNANYYIRPIYIYLDKLNQPKQAMELAQNAVSRFPNSAMSHNLLGWSLIYNQQLNKAEQELKTALTLDPNLDAIYLNYGLLFENRNQYDQALIFYKKANQLGSGDSVAKTATNRYNTLISKFNSSKKTMQANLLQP